MVLHFEDILKLLLAMALGGMLGAERELRDKDAGLRTLMFISTGAAIFTLISIRTSAFGTPADPGRIAAQIVSGIGFLGAGVILRERGQIRGLTTAATIWLAAALGMGVGVGEYLLSTLSAVLVTLTLVVFPQLEAQIGKASRTSTYEVRTIASMDKYEQLCAAFRSLRLRVILSKRGREGDEMTCTWTLSGRPESHEQLIETLFNDPEVKVVEVI
jgi:putative Mg2+ transporter-C (MgtC) family protein